MASEERFWSDVDATNVPSQRASSASSSSGWTSATSISGVVRVPVLSRHRTLTRLIDSTALDRWMSAFWPASRTMAIAYVTVIITTSPWGMRATSTAAALAVSMAGNEPYWAYMRMSTGPPR